MKAQMNLNTKAMRFSNPNPTKSMPCAHVPLGLPCGCHMPGRPSPEAIERHEREVMRRLAWCVRAGRTPAFGHMHEAPGDDGEFVVSHRYVTNASCGSFIDLRQVCFLKPKFFVATVNFYLQIGIFL